MPSLLHEGRISYTCIGFVSRTGDRDRFGDVRFRRSLKTCSRADDDDDDVAAGEQGPRH